MSNKTKKIINAIFIVTISLGMIIFTMIECYKAIVCENYQINLPMLFCIYIMFACYLLIVGSGESKKIHVKYHDEALQPIKSIENGDWVDLRAAETVHMENGECRLISLGVSMKLPEGYEALVVPRSSTCKKFGIIQTNSIGVIDNSYCGDDDIWRFPAYALRDTTIQKNDRICQFRIVRNQPEIKFSNVLKLNGKNRGGFGSTGTK